MKFDEVFPPGVQRTGRHLCTLCLLVLSLSCTKEPGSIAFVFDWPNSRVPQFDAGVDAMLRAELRDVSQTPPRTISTVGPQSYGQELALNFGEIANSEQLQVELKIFDGSTSGRQVLFYGPTDVFELQAGISETIAVRLRKAPNVVVPYAGESTSESTLLETFQFLDSGGEQAEVVSTYDFFSHDLLRKTHCLLRGAKLPLP